MVRAENTCIIYHLSNARKVCHCPISKGVCVMTKRIKKSGPSDFEVPKINIDYIKSNLFRTIAPTGVMSSVTPQGLIHFALYSERQAIPQRVVHVVESDGNLGEEIESIGRDAIVREVEAAVTIDSKTALRFAKRLLELAKEIDGIDKEPKK